MTARKIKSLTRKSLLEKVLDVAAKLCKNYLDVQSGRYGYDLGKRLRSR